MAFGFHVKGDMVLQRRSAEASDQAFFACSFAHVSHNGPFSNLVSSGSLSHLSITLGFQNIQLR
eukprot:scaffold320232_cov14-Tisochrysis_lutea.AAC.1